MEGQEPKIGALTSVAMLSVSAFFDGAQALISSLGFLPTVVTQVLAILVALPLTIFAYLTFIIWFAFKDVRFLNIKKPKVFLARIGGFLAESLPYITLFPILSVSVIMTLISVNGRSGFPASLIPKSMIKSTTLGKALEKKLLK